MKMKKTTFITQGAVIAAIYAVLVFVFDYWSFGPIQFRVAEALTILPVFTPAAVPGLFIGCLIANITGGAVIWDIVFGSLATLIGAVGTYMLRKHPWAAATAADTCKHCYRAVCIKICVWHRGHAVVFYADRGTWRSDCLRCIRQSAQSGIKEVPQYTLS